MHRSAFSAIALLSFRMPIVYRGNATNVCRRPTLLDDTADVVKLLDGMIFRVGFISTDGPQCQERVVKRRVTAANIVIVIISGAVQRVTGSSECHDRVSDGHYATQRRRSVSDTTVNSRVP